MKKPGQSNVERFNNWMKNIVKSVHYANTEQMLLAYAKIEE